MIKHVYIKLYGQVQNVGFRFHTKKLALLYNIKGTVNNHLDGTVEVYAQGDTKTLDIFIAKVTSGASPYSQVTYYNINYLPLNHYQHFKII